MGMTEEVYITEVLSCAGAARPLASPLACAARPRALLRPRRVALAASNRKHTHPHTALVL